MNFLEKILVEKQHEVSELKKNFGVSFFKEKEFYASTCLSFASALKHGSGISVIAEIKKASPSKGVIRSNFQHLEIAGTYSESGVHAISILTDEKFFQGSITYLEEIARTKTLPLLRKDFIIDEIQIHQAKAAGADAVLLISEALDKIQIKELTYCANELSMDVLLELHSPEQIGKIDQSVNTIIGVNNRNLETFEVDLNTSIRLKEEFPKETLFVSESGIASRDDIRTLFRANVDAVLVGEHFMKQQNISAAVKEFLEWCNLES